MQADDFFESEVAMAAAATAALFSPRVRGVFRQGLVYGIAGSSVAARAIADAATSVGRGVSNAVPVGNGASPTRRTGGAPRARAATTARTTASRSRPVRRGAAKRAKSAGAAKKPANP